MSTREPRAYIPIDRREVVERLLAEADAAPESIEPQALRAVAELVQATLHFEFHTHLEAMKAAYAPFDPDSDRPAPPTSADGLSAAAHELAGELSRVLEVANYESVTTEDVERAFSEQALFPIRVVVDFDLYQELLIFARGRRVREVEVSRWFGLRRRSQAVDTYDRICLYVRFKGGEVRADAPIPYKPGSTILKLFRNIPVADLEILLPGCQVRMRLRDKLLLGVPAVVGGVPVLLKLSPVILALGVLFGLSRKPVHHPSLVAGLTGLVFLGAYLFQQWGKVRSRRVRFMKTLSENLYFRNLDNNEGVLTHLIDEAEEEACKEVLLAWVALRRAAEPLAPDALAADVTDWLRREAGVEVAFRTRMTIAQLERLGLARREGDRIVASTPQEALEALDRRWDDLFPYHRPGAWTADLAAVEANDEEAPPSPGEDPAEGPALPASSAAGTTT